MHKCWPTNMCFEQWDCPDTIQAAFRYPGFDVVYEGMMNSSIDDGGLEFRGTEGTLKLIVADSRFIGKVCRVGRIR